MPWVIMFLCFVNMWKILNFYLLQVIKYKFFKITIKVNFVNSLPALSVLFGIKSNAFTDLIICSLLTSVLRMYSGMFQILPSVPRSVTILWYSHFDINLEFHHKNNNSFTIIWFLFIVIGCHYSAGQRVLYRTQNKLSAPTFWLHGFLNALH